MASSVLKAAAEKVGPSVRKQALSLTDAAASRIHHLLNLRQRPFLRLGVKSRGCNGLSYTLNYAGLPLASTSIIIHLFLFGSFLCHSDLLVLYIHNCNGERRWHAFDMWNH